MRTVLALLLLAVWALPAAAQTAFVRLSDQQRLTIEALADELDGIRLVLVGERHDEEAHHALQLEVIEALRAQGRKVAIGLEMFQADNQGVLDAWVAGGITRDLFQVTFADQWGMWPLYAPILDTARQQELPLVGLNISRAISGRVAQQGFDALPPVLRDQIGVVRCLVAPGYARYLHDVLDLYNPHNGFNFEHFCEAQVLWDTVMAQQAERYLAAHPDRVLVVLAGATHAWRYGIPTQLHRLPPEQVRIILPGKAGLSELTAEVADYLALIAPQP